MIKKFLQFVKLSKGDMNRCMKTAEIIFGLNNYFLNSRVNCTTCPSAQIILAACAHQY